jgi:hypothetical protein
MLVLLLLVVAGVAMFKDMYDHVDIDEKQVVLPNK